MDNNPENNALVMQLVSDTNMPQFSEWADNPHHTLGYQSLTSKMCTEDNVNEYIAYLNKVFRNMCLSSWIEEEENQIVSLVNACSELIERCQQDSRIREDLETRTHRTMSDYDQLQTALLRLKDDVERLEREIALRQEKEKDLCSKNRNLSSAIKSEKDEVKRLQSVINHRDSQYKHESKKKERETNRLKEKLNQVLMDKTQKLIGNEVINTLPKTDSKRGTWKTTSKPEELYKLMLQNYEEKQKEMMQENLELRSCLSNVQQKLHFIAECYRNKFTIKSSGSPSNSSDESICFEEDLEEFNDKFQQFVCNGEASDIGYLPFETTKEEILDSFNKTCHFLIKLLKIKLKDSDDEIAANLPLPPFKTTNSPVELEQQLSELKKELEEYKEIIELQDQVLRNAVESMPDSQPNNSFLHESHLLFEYEELEAKKRLFLEEKENFDKERLLFTNAAIRLAEEKRSFHDEKFQQIKQQILDLTPKKGRTKLNPSSCSKEYGNRVLPATPQHSAVYKPNKSEIYKTIDLCQNHFQNRVHHRCSLENFNLCDSFQSSPNNQHPSTHSQSCHESFQHNLPSTPRLSSNNSPSCRRQSAPIKYNSTVFPSLQRNTNFNSLTSLNDDKIYLSPECPFRIRSQSADDNQRLIP